MPFSIPDKGAGQADVQSILFSEYMNILMAGIQGIDYPFNGCAVSAQGSPNMTVAVAAGAVVSAGALKVVSAGNVTVTTANGSNPRIDLIVIDSSGTKTIRTGTAAAAPRPPARTANDVVLAAVYVPANATTITTGLITDLRVLQNYAQVGVSLPSNHVNGTATPTEVTGLTVPLEVGSYVFEYSLIYQIAGAVTNGLRLSVNFTGTNTAFVANSRQSADSANGRGNQSFQTSTGAYQGGFSARAVSTAGWGVTVGVDNNNVDMFMRVEGMLVVSVAGNLALWSGCSTTANATIKAGSSLLLRKTG